MPLLQSISAPVRFYTSLLVTGGVFAALDAGTCVLRLSMPEGPRRRRMARRWLCTMARLAVGYLHRAGILDCDMAALTTIAQRRNLVLVANHPSRLDCLILASALPHMVCVTKASIWERGVLGSTLRTAGYVRHDGLLKIIGPASQSLREDCQLLLFPEGTRSRAGEQAGPIQPGFAAIAQRMRADVQVVLIETQSPYLSQGWPFLRRPPLPMRYRITLGPDFGAPSRDEASGRALMDAVERCFQKNPPRRTGRT
ncbi:MAG: lysophospholipid acyltransferase family protein [Acetobacter okinawensis]|uniref:lysophospholipid acyltransferase family protein n=1 Tax=Acetobacter okinawensis TaxID=1076594 RepID=UPI0039EA839E